MCKYEYFYVNVVSHTYICKNCCIGTKISDTNSFVGRPRTEQNTIHIA